MAATITDTTKNPILVPSGGTVIPFSSVTVNDPFLTAWDTVSGGGSGTLTITLHSLTGGPLGSLRDADPNYGGNGSFDPKTGTFTEKTFGGPTVPDFVGPTADLHRIVYAAPALSEGQSEVVTATISFTGSTSTANPYPTPNQTSTATVTDPTKVVLDVIAQPTGAANFGITDTTTGLSMAATGHPYTGPVSYLMQEIVLLSPDNLAVASAMPNAFIHTGSGKDAIDVSRAGGNNVLDGGTGSNYLVGGSGNDTFFVDDRGPTSSVWSTVVGFHAGDAATVWGVTPQDFALQWQDGQGAVGATGLTLHAFAVGKPDASLTLAGYTTADLTNGRVTVSYGAIENGTYMLIQGA